MQVDSVLETCLYVDDLPAAEDFYQRVLGLIFYSRVEGRHTFFRCGAAMLLLFNPETTLLPSGAMLRHGATGPGHVAFAIPSADVDAWRDHLRRLGVAIEAEITWPTGGHSIYFRDPAGNSVELATRQTWRIPE